MIKKHYLYHLDQSIRIEQTNKDSIIGLASLTGNDSFTLIVPAKIKRQLQERYRRQGLPKRFCIEIFIVSVIATISNSQYQIHELIIDQEYPGYELKIIQAIEEYFDRQIHVHIATIGKHSPAHYAAYGVHLNKLKANTQTSLSDLLAIIHKKDRG